ncbi:MAG: hypothetical protein HY22_01225 [[Candidatus Thermochlorobacteriaceae] bacterium GBChlB]|nr:MAG: hypothetical protein HY22_01225 [[Candidatus Thermochlorobacteriaceae] bacterium GBChlB]
MKLPSLNFATKLAVVLTLVAVLPLALVGYSLSVLNLDTLKNLSRELYLSTANSVAARLEQRLQETTRLLLEAARLLDNRTLSPADATSLVSSLLANNSTAGSIGVYDNDGAFIDAFVKTGRSDLPSRFPLSIKRALDSLESVVSLGEQFQVGVKWKLNGENAGYLLTQPEPRALANLIGDVSAKTFSGQRDRVYLLDSDVRIFIHADSALAARRESLIGRGLFSDARSSDDVFLMKPVGVSQEYVGFTGEPMLGTWISLPQFRAAIVVEEPQRVAYFSVREMQWRVLVGSLIGAATASLVSLFLAKRLNQPIAQLVDAARRFAKQEFDFRFSETRGDEFDTVFQAYNDVAETLGRYQKINVNKLVAERNKLDAALQQAGDGMIVIDSARQAVLVNPLFAKWFSLPKMNLNVEPKPIETLIANEQLRAIIDSAFASEAALMPVECRVRLVGEARETVLRGTVVRVESEGELVALLGVLRDVTKDVDMDRMKTELVSIVAHELRSPLATISGFSSLILDSQNELSRETREFVEIIYKQSERLGNIVTKFLDLNRLESGRADIQRAPFKLHDVVATTVEINRPLADAKHIAVKLNLPSNSTPILGDAELIGQVVLNLFSNAVKYSEPNKTVYVEMLEHQECMEVAVRDEGFGISASAKEKLFSKFFRAVDDDRVRANIGTGLGLAFVKEIVEKHGGTVSVESELYKGSCFRFTLPK